MAGFGCVNWSKLDDSDEQLASARVQATTAIARRMFRVRLLGAVETGQGAVLTPGEQAASVATLCCVGHSNKV